MVDAMASGSEPGSPPRPVLPSGPGDPPVPGRRLSLPPPAPPQARRRSLGAHSARSLLLTVLGEYVLPGGEPVWTAGLIAVMAELGVGEKAARQALGRTAAEGWIVSRRDGRHARWRLTDSGRRLLADGASRIYSFGRERRDWDGRWVVLLVSGPHGGRELRRQLGTRLTWAGFGELLSGAWVCPDARREPEAAAILAELGLASTSMSFLASFGAIGSQSDIIGLAWDLPAVEARYKEFIDSFAALEPATHGETLVAQTLLVHEWRSFPFIDPQLPHDLLPPGWLGTQAAALFRARHDRWQPGAHRHFLQLCTS
ncbi:MAG TPA: PaaX family transcriptional regulator C-terminal domain-containing protein [Streptosporangiaceae bacterium]|nr:PaaX family transcriptional regulator C-terminal domain-containing protein [Streptosporangiaceae bacterium]